MRTLPWYLLLVLIAAPSFAASPDSMNHDLLEVTVPQLEQMYREHKYTVTQVVQWYMARIAKYNGIYRAVQTVDTAGALAAAAREDAEASPHGALWGVPIAAPRMAAPATPTMCALAPEVLPGARSPPSPQTSPSWATEQIRAIPFVCRPLPVPWWEYSPLEAW